MDQNVRTDIIRLWLHGESIRSVAREKNLPLSTVAGILRKFKNTGLTCRGRPGGRPLIELQSVGTWVSVASPSLETLRIAETVLKLRLNF